MNTKKLFLRTPLAAMIVGLPILLLTSSCNKTNPVDVKQDTAGIDIILTQTWTPTDIHLVKGQSFTVTTTGEMDWYTGHCGGKCTSTPDGTECNNPGFAYPKLTCWSLIGKIGANGEAFQVGTNFTMTADRAGELFLGVNDNNYPDNTGTWHSTVKLTPPACDPYPQPGDIQNLLFEKQGAADWCWAAVARVMMAQSNPALVVEQCTQVSAVDFGNRINCCGNQNTQTCSLAGGSVETSIAYYGFAYNKTTSLSENDIVRELSVNQRPIAMQIGYQISTASYGFHYEVIYGYYYIGNEMHVRIWDPQPGFPTFRCNTWSLFPEDIGNLSIRVLNYVMDVQKKP